MNRYFAEINAPAPVESWADSFLTRWHRSRHHPGKIKLLRLAHALTGKRAVIARLDRGIAMELDPADYVQRELLCRGGYEAETLRLLERLLASATAFWDFGAHMGLYTLPAARSLAGRGGRVIAIEPNPAQCHALLRNLLLNNLANVTLCPTACGDTETLTQLITPDGDNTGGSRLGTYIRADSRRTRLVVPVLPAAVLARKFGLSDSALVKIDTEGQEFAILDSLLTVARPAQIIVEYFAGNHRREDVQPRFEAYAKLGYELRSVDGSPWDRESDLPDQNLWLSRMTP